MGARNRVGMGLLYRAARALELIPGLLESLKIPSLWPPNVQNAERRKRCAQFEADPNLFQTVHCNTFNIS